MKLEFPRQIFEKFSIINFYENPSSETEFSMRKDGRADRRRERVVEDNSRSPKFCERA
jgi:hypothetical protein